jgi:nitroreductase
MNIIEKLQRRYATKVFDPTKKVAEEDMHILLESLRLTPSSFGLQPRKFIRVTSPELRLQLQANSRNQPQITQASDIIIIATRTTLDEHDVEDYMESVKTIRKPAGEVSEADNKKVMEYKQMISNTVSSKTAEEQKRRNQKQAYIAMGVLLTTAASMGIDTCPMEGFDPAKYDEIL